MSRISSKIVALVFISQLLVACGSSGSANLEGGSVSTSGGTTTTGGTSTTTTNTNPNANAGNNQTVEELDSGTLRSTTVYLTGSGTDSDGTIASYSWTQIAGIPVSVNTSTSNNANFDTPEVSSVTVLTFELTVKDNAGGAGSDTMTVTVNPHVTAANAGMDQVVEELDLDTLTPITVRLFGSSSADSDGSKAVYKWEQVLQTGDLEVSLSDANTSALSFSTPTVLRETVLTFKLTVSDHPDDIGTDTVNITITPHIVGANAGTDQTVSELDSVTLMPSQVVLSGGSDTDNNADVSATFEWEQTAGPSVTLNEASTATPSFLVPEVEEETVMTFMLTATEGGNNTGTDLVDITINQHIVVANAGMDQVVEEQSTVTLSGSSQADPNRTIATYQWSQLVPLGGVPVELTNASTSDATFIAPFVNAETELTFELTVTDNEGDTGTDIVVITVTVLNSAAKAEAGMYQYVLSNEGVQLSGSFSRDLEDVGISYAWTQVDNSGVDVALDFNNIEQPIFTAPTVTAAITLIFKLEVKDTTGVVLAFDTVNIAVSPRANEFDAADDTDGKNGLSYTKMDEYGIPLPQSASAWSCVLDNRTGLVWEVKSPDVNDLQYGANIYGWFQPTVDTTVGLTDDDDDSVGEEDIVNGSLFDVDDNEVGDEGNAIMRDIDDNIIHSSEDQCLILGDGCVSNTETYIAAMNDGDLSKPQNINMCRGRNGNDSTWFHYSKWRLPTLNELVSINDSTVVGGPQVDVNYFPNMRNDAYWSYTTDANDYLKAWTHYFSDGQDGVFMKVNPDPLIFDNMTTSLPVILVRDKE